MTAKDQRDGLDLDALVAMADQPEIRRLEGDDLYLWAKLIAEIEHLQQRVNQVGKQLLIKYGCGDPRYVLTDNGYIVTADSLRSGEGGPDNSG